jgi:hypothetical protein
MFLIIRCVVQLCCARRASEKAEVVAAVVIDALASLDLRYPEVSKAQSEELAVTKRELIASEDL